MTNNNDSFVRNESPRNSLSRKTNDLIESRDVMYQAQAYAPPYQGALSEKTSSTNDNDTDCCTCCTIS